MGHKFSSVVSRPGNTSSSWPSSNMFGPFEFCFGQVFRNALRRSSRAGAGPGIVASILKLSSGIWPDPGLVP
ncbi:hypothetical protein LINPERPRIM_LOCUS38055, partial [Linum perenne]